MTVVTYRPDGAPTDVREIREPPREGESAVVRQPSQPSPAKTFSTGDLWLGGTALLAGLGLLLWRRISGKRRAEAAERERESLEEAIASLPSGVSEPTTWPQVQWRTRHTFEELRDAVPETGINTWERVQQRFGHAGVLIANLIHHAKKHVTDNIFQMHQAAEDVVALAQQPLAAVAMSLDTARDALLEAGTSSKSELTMRASSAMSELLQAALRCPLANPRDVGPLETRTYLGHESRIAAAMESEASAGPYVNALLALGELARRSHRPDRAWWIEHGAHGYELVMRGKSFAALSDLEHALDANGAWECTPYRWNHARGHLIWRGLSVARCEQLLENLKRLPERLLDNPWVKTDQTRDSVSLVLGIAATNGLDTFRVMRRALTIDPRVGPFWFSHHGTSWPSGEEEHTLEITHPTDGPTSAYQGLDRGFSPALLELAERLVRTGHLSHFALNDQSSSSHGTHWCFSFTVRKSKAVAVRKQIEAIVGTENVVIT